jgi:GMP reductase
MKFDFEQINLIPQKCIVESRSECDTSVKLGNFTFKMPVIPANMECVIDHSLALELGKKGYFYIMHRFLTAEEILNFITLTNSMNELANPEYKVPVSISVGVNQDSYDLIDALSYVWHPLRQRCLIGDNFNVDFITIDIAHGHSIKMEKMIKYIREKLPNVFIIAGNVSTLEAVKDLAEWGADAAKVGIGPGSACTTWPATGFGSRNCQASTILECSKYYLPIIADGGIRVPADIAKSIVLGATMVMLGGMMSGFKDSPGNLIDVNGQKKKEFWGSASQFQSGKSNRIEGTKYLIDFKDRSILDEMIYLKECLQSSISYGGGNNLSSLKNVKWV